MVQIRVRTLTLKAKNEKAQANIIEARNDFPVFIVNEHAKYHIIHFLT